MKANCFSIRKNSIFKKFKTNICSTKINSEVKKRNKS